MLRTILLAACLALPALTASAQRSGTYAVEGQTASGQGYQGSLTLAASGPQSWIVTWRVGNTTARGVGLMVKGMLVVGYVSDSETGVVAYEAMPDGRLAGRWTQGREGGVGTETLSPR
ncbi:MAG: hypothetical protein JWR10_1239 [Rubritepida sp.]|nr:hypothetical protein [Rubritepida sp.]